MAGARPIRSTNTPRAAAQVATLHVPPAADQLPLRMARPHFSAIEGVLLATPGLVVLVDADVTMVECKGTCSRIPDGELHPACAMLSVNRSSAPASDGLGLGLHIAKALVHAHGGRMAVEIGSTGSTASQVAEPVCAVDSLDAAPVHADAVIFQGFAGRAAGGGTIRTKVPWCSARTLIRLRRLRNLRHPRWFGLVPGRPETAAPQMEIEV